jgi:hypothetical protein
MLARTIQEDGSPVSNIDRMRSPGENNRWKVGAEQEAGLHSVALLYKIMDQMEQYMVGGNWKRQNAKGLQGKGPGKGWR